jgi:hypothetical protein
LLGELDDDACRAADVAEPTAFLVLLRVWRMPGVFAGASVSALTAVGV